jgi:hypothetical protein
MDNKTLYVTLAISASLGLLFTLLLYVWLSGRNPISRLEYALFVSVLPAVGALVVLKLTKLFVSWRGAVLIYFLLFLLVFSQILIRSIFIH